MSAAVALVAAVNGAELTYAPAPADNPLKGFVPNTGVAPFYYDWPVDLGLLGEDGRLAATWKTDWKLTGVLAGEPAAMWRFQRGVRGLGAGMHRLLLRVANPLTNGPPLRFANETQDRDLRGWLTVGDPLAAEPMPVASGAGTLGPFVKHPTPILSPTRESIFHCPVRDRQVRWEEQNVYNPAAVVRDGKVYLFYRADDKSPDLEWGRTCRIGMAWSEDGIHFTRHATPVLYPENDRWKEYEWEGGCEDLHIVEGEDGVYYMNYSTWNGRRDTVSVANSRDLVHWTKHGPAFRKAGQVGGRSGVVVSRLVGNRLVAAKIGGKYWMYYTHPCALAWSDNLIDWTPTGEAVWPGGDREAGAIALLRDDGILLMTQGTHPTLGTWVLRQALIDRNDLKTILKEQAEPFLYPEYDWEKQGFLAHTTVANTLVPFKGQWWLYYGAADRCIGVAQAGLE